MHSYHPNRGGARFLHPTVGIKRLRVIPLVSADKARDIALLRKEAPMPTQGDSHNRRAIPGTRD